MTAATFPANCSACHDVSAPTVKSGPVCQTCHVAASPLTSLNCTSCHANPPNSGAPAGAAYPNIAGAHSTHIALNSAGTPISCDTCHSGLGAGTLNHYNLAKARVDPGDAAFSAGFLYTGITGTAVTFNNALATLSCSNVSCHGAQGTPNWRTGTTVCTSCHNSASVAPASYNDYTQTFITHNQQTHSHRAVHDVSHDVAREHPLRHAQRQGDREQGGGGDHQPRLRLSISSAREPQPEQLQHGVRWRKLPLRIGPMAVTAATSERTGPGGD